MRLYLSSFRLGDRPERLVELIPPPARVAVIANAIDAEPADVRAEKVRQEIAWLTELGLSADELDLRDWFPDPGRAADAKRLRDTDSGGTVDAQGLREQLISYQGVWVRGGNVFVLRSAMARSAADTVLHELVASDAIVYAGYSAGPCVLAPSLRGLEMCDDPGAVAATGGELRWDGLGLIDEAFVPHVDSPGHPETELLARTAEFYRDTGVPHLTLRDGQALIVNGTHRTLL
ncbi:MAG TPA: Type 1 glutamine amidotransferase-like domain-containing protein [Kribbella sp.]|nr:Type 1 glutamine amidotransferase-like domain-containing protein [Kribbella sp.]